MSNKIKVNELQQKTINTLLKVLPKAHFTNVRVRINGEWKEYQADWLLELLHIYANNVNNDKRKKETI